MRLAVISCVIACLCVCEAARGQVATVTLDFGKVTEAVLERGTQTVSLINESDQTVVIDSVSAGCGCVKVAWSGPLRLAPGQTFETIARLEPSLIRPGAFAYPIVAEVNGSQTQIGEVRFQYEPRVVPSQRVIWLQSLDGLNRLEARFGVLTGADTDITDVEISAPSYMSAELKLINDQSGEVTLAYLSKDPLRERGFDVLLQARGSDDSPVRIRVLVPALDLVALDPGAVLFAHVRVAEPATRSIRLRALTTQSLEAMGIEAISDDDRVRCALREADGALWLDVTVLATEPGVASASVILRDRQQTWAVPVPATWRADG